MRRVKACVLLLVSWVFLSGVQGLDLLYPANKEIDEAGTCPNQFTTNLIESPLYGGTTGNYFFEVMTPRDRVEVVGITFRYGWFLDGLRFEYSDGNNTFWGAQLGNIGGGEYNWTVPNGTYINRIRVFHDIYFVNGLQFICADGSSTPVMGAYQYTYD